MTQTPRASLRFDALIEPEPGAPRSVIVHAWDAETVTPLPESTGSPGQPWTYYAPAAAIFVSIDGGGTRFGPICGKREDEP